jgi:cob(I)alamin adenosyltransferase
VTSPRIYTRTGDTGETGLFGGPRVRKDDPRLDAFGTIDELNAVIGIAVAALDYPAPGHPDLRTWLQAIQSDLFDVGGELATPDIEERIAWGQVTGPRITEDDIAKLEDWIDVLDEELEPLTRFILPGGHPAAAHLHHARTVCRRAERRLVTLARMVPMAPHLVRYLNRLSDLLFTVARAANARAGVEEPQWLGRVER